MNEVKERLSWYDIENLAMSDDCREMLVDYCEAWCMKWNSAYLVDGLEKWFRIQTVTINDMGEVGTFDDAGDPREYSIESLFRFIVGCGHEYATGESILLKIMLRRFVERIVLENENTPGFIQCAADYFQVSQERLLCRFGRFHYADFNAKPYRPEEVAPFICKRFKIEMR